MNIYDTSRCHGNVYHSAEHYNVNIYHTSVFWHHIPFNTNLYHIGDHCIANIYHNSVVWQHHKANVYFTLVYHNANVYHNATGILIASVN